MVAWQFDDSRGLAVAQLWLLRVQVGVRFGGKFETDVRRFEHGGRHVALM